MITRFELSLPEWADDAVAATPAHLPGLDGLRALAVLAVVLYHAEGTAGGSWIPGGFLGVDVFFVVSGFLISRLLLDEGRSTGGIAIVRFWQRRARRRRSPACARWARMAANRARPSACRARRMNATYSSRGATEVIA